MTEIKMHICVVSPSFNIGGIERTVSEFANYFIKKGHSVTFLSLLDGKRYFELEEGVKVITPDFKRSTNIIINFFYRLRLIFYIRQKVRSSGARVVLCMADTFNFLVIGALLGMPVQVFVGDVTQPNRKFPLTTRLGKKYLYPKATGFIAQTQFAARYYRTLFGEKFNMCVINGAVKQINKQHGVREKLILNVGRLSYEKGQDRLLDAFSKIEHKHGWKLVFTADGPFRPHLQAQVQKERLNDHVIFAGKVEDIDNLYARAAIFVLPSRIEGFPNALTEAMAAGLPCICFDSFAANEIITDGLNGFIIPDGRIDLLTQRLKMLMDDPATRVSIGKNAEVIADRLNINRIGMQMLDFITSNRYENVDDGNDHKRT